MDRDEALKGQQEQNWAAPPKAAERGLMMGLDKPAQPHPREILLSDLNDQEQRLLDRLHALREIRQEICCLPRDEGERLIKICRLMERAAGQPRNF